ncbi:hypothetical protein T03_13103 [Trichinella britovi]|uniref:Uncharacterized protein n=1 Tax=Trichinella britovi TaxID=45882 RepID=A0A0V1DFL2_TRIBR|nr:hypothetical protein T03_13103 [Trichinella britovi]
MAEHCNCYCCDLELLDWHHYTKIINDQVMKLMTKHSLSEISFCQQCIPSLWVKLDAVSLNYP